MSALVDDSNPWLIRFLSCSDPQLRLFCFPYAGGSAQLFRTWEAGLPGVEVCAIELPGRGRRFGESLVRRLPKLVKEIALAIRPECDRPFAYFGHSMGALLAFELCRYQESQGLQLPQLLALSSHKPPQLPRFNDNLHQLTDEAFLAEMQRLGGTPPEVLANPEMQQLFFPIVRADFEVIETYVYEERKSLDIPFAIFGAYGDQEVPPETLSSWQEHSTKSISQYLFEGDHFYLSTCQKELLKVLGSLLSKL